MPPPLTVNGDSFQQGLFAAYELLAFCLHRLAADQRYSLWLMIEFTCPSCKSKFSAFSHGWQAQRSSSRKVCPVCGAAVTASFGLKPFLIWFGLFTSLSVLVAFLLGPAGFGAFFVPGLLAALFFSVRLQNEP
jgi:hypothetical protein